MSTAYLPEYLEGIRLHNAQRFWHAHEALEAIWLEADGVERDFYQGLIQVSAACFHIVRDNWSGAHKLLHSAIANLLPAGETYLGMDLASLHRRLDGMLDEVHRVRYEGKAGFDYDLIPLMAVDGVALAG